MATEPLYRDVDVACPYKPSQGHVHRKKCFVVPVVPVEVYETTKGRIVGMYVLRGEVSDGE